ncbi:hypothetical protein [Bradyrhizobium sp. CCBAU 45384]|uniref:hypothetical protein n=1 Tax=Bradyrhizobium sp. CCBAU 45384 TaxID=858428 RepID=UPI002304F8B1|nr:hypothetical protein [Bradyrhizobium sp. CCBAU 45384]
MTTTNILIEALADGWAIGKSPCPINGCSKNRFRNKSRHISLKLDRAATKAAPRETVRGKIIMTDRDPFAEGERAARENIPAEANPYTDGSDEHALWAAGHEKVAGTIEARESEGN